MNKKFEEDTRIYEYTSAANPKMPFIPVMTYLADSYQSGETRVIYFDNKESLETPYKATSPNLLASFIRICESIYLSRSIPRMKMNFHLKWRKLKKRKILIFFVKNYPSRRKKLARQ